MTATAMPVVHLQVLGPVSVARTGGSDAALRLTQPRRVAVLVYLALARPRGLHARDTLIALLWPEADHASARHALRNALHATRLALGDVLVSAGDALVGLDRTRVVCDALLMEDDLAAGRVEEAAARYEGEPLQGFHVSDAPEFERWLDAERQRLHDLVLRAAWRAADEHRVRGDLGAALRLARRAAALAPDDELSLRRLIGLCAAAGDPGSALRAYDEFAVRLREECDAEPAADTRSLVHDVRMGRPTPSAGVPTQLVPPLNGSRRAAVVAPSEPTIVPLPARELVPTTPVPPESRRTARPSAVLIIVVVAVLLLAAAFAAALQSSADVGAAVTTPAWSAPGCCSHPPVNPARRKPVST